MSVLTGSALHQQLTAVMEVLTRAAVAEICGLVDGGFATLQAEISRSHRENRDLKEKLHLIQSIVVRGGGTAAEPELLPDSEGEQLSETAQRRRDGDGGDPAAAAGGGAAELREETPDVVLIKDEDSDSNDSFEEDNKTPIDGVMAAARDSATSTPVSRSMKRLWPVGKEADRKSSTEPLTLKAAGTQKQSATVYSLDSPRSEPGCSSQLCGDEMEASESVCSYSSQMDLDVQVVQQDGSLGPPSSNRPTYFGNVAPIESPSSRELDLSLTWTKQSKSHMTFAQFHQNENLDADAFGLKMISVSGSISTDCQLSESSNSAFEYDDGDMINLAHYQTHDQSGRPQLCNGQPGARGRRFVCAVCSKTYATSQNLEVHMRIHTGERPFTCSQCGKKFTQSAHLKSHLSVHSGERPYTCTLCARSFIVKYSLKLHMKKCHENT